MQILWRVFKWLAVASMAFCAISLLWWITAQVVKRSYVSKNIQDYGNKIVVRVSEFSWDGSGLLLRRWHTTYSETSASSLPGSGSIEPYTLNDLRTVLTEGTEGPLDVEKTIPRWEGFGTGQYIRHDTVVASFNNITAVIPFYFLVLLFVLFPAVRGVAYIFHRVRSCRRPKLGHCPRCGYDLRASPDGLALLDRCPECGTSTTKGTP